jgi:hypothetical protein
MLWVRILLRWSAIKFVSDLRQVSGFPLGTPDSSTNKKIKEPELAYKIPTEDESANFLFSGASKVTILYVEIDYTFLKINTCNCRMGYKCNCSCTFLCNLISLIITIGYTHLLVYQLYILFIQSPNIKKNHEIKNLNRFFKSN